MNRQKNTKTILSGILSLVIAGSYTGAAFYGTEANAAEEAKTEAVSGDVNGDESVNSSDLLTMTKYLLGNDVKIVKENADLNSDGKVNIIDAVLLTGKLRGDGTDPATEPGAEPSADPAVDPTSDPAADPAEETKTITLKGASAAAEGSGVKVEGSIITISEPGTYAISGKLDDGQIVVDVDKTAYPEGVVELSLEGAEITSKTTSPVYVASVADECVIKLKKGTENVISDSKEYTNADGSSGAIYSKDDLKIKGKGSLTVNGNCTDGIVSKDSVKIFNGTVTVNAVDDGIRGKDSVKIGDSDDTEFTDLVVTVNSTEGDGIRATNGSEEGKGKVIINGGTVNVTAYADGIQAEQTFTMNGGDLTVKTYEGSAYTASGSQTGGNTNPWGGRGGMGMDGNANKTDVSAKGIKAVGIYDEAGTTWQSGGDIIIKGGTITIDSSDDALHCGGSMTITGGVFNIATADDAFHSDHELAIGTKDAGTYDDVQIYVSKCYEGVEGVTINQNSGTVYVVSGDDGYNAAGGNDGSGKTNQGPWGGGGFGGGSTGTLNVNGGLVIINSASGDHDALDSNGDINLNGGYVYVNGQEPLDCGDGGSYSIKYNGGSVITMTAGNTNLKTVYSFKDSSGNVIASFYGASGNPGQNCTNSTAWTGGTVSGGTSICGGNVTLGGTVSGGTQITATASSGGMQPGGPGGQGGRPGRNW